jgi:hypothetical protein
MELIDSKSLLAKLMATENLIVEHRNVRTASFDVKNRVLVIPTLDKNLSTSLYDLFTGHEVGHALYTPMEGMLEAKRQKVNKDIANVVEDCRIERKIKNKYPGLRLPFLKAYQELIEKDFFATKGKNLNLMNFLDRLNLYTKGGVSLGIKFDDVERVLVNDVEATETYDDVIEVSKRIAKYMQEQLEEQKAKDKEKSLEEDDNDDDDFDFEDAVEDLDDDSKQKRNSSSFDEDGDVEDSDNEDDNGSGDSAIDDNNLEDSSSDPQIRSFTDEAFRENESKLFEFGEDYLYANIPKMEVDKVIYDYKPLWKRYKEEEFCSVKTQEYLNIRRESNKVVSYLVKEFEMRKNADQLKRASTAKTGDLDMKKLFSYGFSEDIFKKVTVVPGGKSHGLVLFLDWSGSMTEHIANTMKQLLNLTFFCKKVNIPFEVYTFVEDIDTEQNYFTKPKKGDLVAKRFGLCNILSSRMSAAEFTYAGSALVAMSGCVPTGRKTKIPYWMSMSGTPLNETVIAAMEIVPHFQKKYKLQIVNTVFLTDGEGSPIYEIYLDDEGHTEYQPRNNRRSLVIRDPVTKEQEIMKPNASSFNQTSALIRLLKKRTNSNIVGFYVLNIRELNGSAGNLFFPDYNERYKVKEQFRKDKFFVVQNTGFDEYYLLRSSGLDTDEDATFEVKENATKRGIVSAFSKYAGNRINNRVILNRFINLIT